MNNRPFATSVVKAELAIHMPLIDFLTGKEANVFVSLVNIYAP
jgi:hypothetical protein